MPEPKQDALTGSGPAQNQPVLSGFERTEASKIASEFHEKIGGQVSLESQAKNLLRMYASLAGGFLGFGSGMTDPEKIARFSQFVAERNEYLDHVRSDEAAAMASIQAANDDSFKKSA